jgi:hypothetical protein
MVVLAVLLLLLPKSQALMATYPIERSFSDSPSIASMLMLIMLVLRSFHRSSQQLPSKSSLSPICIRIHQGSSSCCSCCCCCCCCFCGYCFLARQSRLGGGSGGATICSLLMLMLPLPLLPISSICLFLRFDLLTLPSWCRIGRLSLLLLPLSLLLVGVISIPLTIVLFLYRMKSDRVLLFFRFMMYRPFVSWLSVCNFVIEMVWCDGFSTLVWVIKTKLHERTNMNLPGSCSKQFQGFVVLSIDFD